MDELTTTEGQQRLAVLLRSHVERCLQQIWQTTDLVVDADGDYPYRVGTAACWVSVCPDPPQVRVFGYAARGLRPTTSLLREVTDLNARSRWAKVVLEAGIVQVRVDLHWSAVDRPALARAVQAVGQVADEVGTLLASLHGGHTPFPPETVTHDTTEEAA